MRLLPFIFAIIIALTSCNNESSETLESTSEEETKQTEMYNGIPITEKEPDNYTGEYLELYKNDLPKIRGHKVEGVRQGKWEGWHFTGAKASEGTYIDGKEDGVYTVYYDNGKIRYKGRYEMGTKTGSWKSYSEEGKLTLDSVHKL